jgi:hypothetical protein
MVRRTIAAVLFAGVTVGWTIAPATADEPVADASELQLTADGGALDSATLDGVSGGALVGAPTEEGAWRDADAYSYPIDIPGSVNPAGSGIAHGASLGGDMGAHPPAGGAIGGAGAVAGDVANTLF